MKIILVFIGAVALIMSCLSAAVLIGPASTGAVRDTLAEMQLLEDDGDTSTGQHATAVCVGLLNVRNCNIDQSATATSDTANRLPIRLDDAIVGIVGFGMVFVFAALVAAAFGSFFFSSDWG